MKVGIDLDEVLVDFMKYFVLFYNSKNGSKVTRNKISEYRFWKLWGDSKEETDKTFNEFYKSSLFKNITPIKGAKNGIKKFSF